jgi:hypothetical protein
VRVGPYALQDEIGRGGMGAVYRATHVTTGAVHAVKVVTPGAPEDALRFLREAEAMARVEGHPHVLRVHASGQEQGRLWLAMEWAPGGSLAARLASGPLPVDALAPLGRALALGLAHVHARGVLHRDLKPENVLFDAEGAPKLADFGVARVEDARSLTQTGAMVGTPMYMAPEQALAAPGIDERADVYGLGAILYHAATGQPPFANGPLMAVLDAVIRTAPADPRRLRPELPAWLARELLRALAKSPADRHPSALALAAALAAGSTSRGRARLFVGGALVVAAAAVGLALVAAPRAVAPAVAPVHTARAARPPLDPLARAEELLRQGDARAALDAARPLAGDDARWVRLRALLQLEELVEARRLVDGERLPRDLPKVARALVTLAELRAELVLLDRQLDGLRTVMGGSAPELTSVNVVQPVLDLARALERLRAIERPDELARATGATGVTVLRRLMGTLTALFPELLRLVRGDLTQPMSVTDLAATLRRLVAAAPEAEEARSLQLVSHWLCVRAPPSSQRAPEDVAALARGRTDPTLPPALRRLAHLTLIGTALQGDDSLAAIAQDVELLGVAPAPSDALTEAFRDAAEKLALRLLDLAGRDPAQRATAVARLRDLLSDMQDDPFDDGTARMKVVATLLGGEEPTEQELEVLRPNSVYRHILEAEVLLGRGEHRAAADRYRSAMDRQRGRARIADPSTGLALALTLAGDHEGAEAALADLTEVERRTAYLPWRTAERVSAAMALARAGTWAPSPGRPFPPE